MIDFAKFGEAGWRSLGLAPGAFEEIYTQNRAQSNEDALDADPVAISILRLMANKSEWIGTAAQLLSDLGPGDRDWLWPKNATQLGKHLRRLSSLLRQRGLEIEFDKAPNATRSRLIPLKKTKESSVHSVQPSTLPGK
jgi:putative DNA primase/helicase